MNKRKLNHIFAKIKTETNMDFAITNTDDYGDCNSCVWCELATQYGIESKGIYIKHWLKGMNKGKPYKDLDGVYIGHDIIKEQAEKMVEIFKENGYDIQPTEYNPSKAYYIKEVN